MMKIKRLPSRPWSLPPVQIPPELDITSLVKVTKGEQSKGISSLPCGSWWPEMVADKFSRRIFQFGQWLVNDVLFNSHLNINKQWRTESNPTGQGTVTQLQTAERKWWWEKETKREEVTQEGKENVNERQWNRQWQRLTENFKLPHGCETDKHSCLESNGSLFVKLNLSVSQTSLPFKLNEVNDDIVFIINLQIWKQGTKDDCEG